MRTWLLHFLFGISSGLPYLLTGSTLQAWMTEQKVDLKAIGIFALVRTPYSLKFLWAPFMDKIRLPFLTRRRGWMIATQVLLALALLGLGFSDPTASPLRIAVFAVLVSVASASQDIVIDGYRTETLTGNIQGLATSSYITGYRVGMLVAGAFALLIVDHFHFTWAGVYALMAAFLSVGAIAALIAPESPTSPAPRTMKEAVVEPFLEFFKRPGAWVMLLFILFFKFGDNLAGAMTTPFILSSGYTKTEYAIVAKGAGFIAVMAGGILGGPLMLRLGILRSLLVFGIGQALAVSGFIWLALVPKDMTVLSIAIVGENFFIGCGAAAFSAFLSSITNARYSATQYALLTSLMSFSSTVLSTPSGWLAAKLGWAGYFGFCAALAAPGLLLLIWVRKHWELGRG
jgi:PAT family beta-lactamase induction signal transducer AmpG